MKLKPLGLFAATLALLLSLTALQAKQVPPGVKADTKDPFAQVADHVRDQMQSGGRFEFLTADERSSVTQGPR